MSSKALTQTRRSQNIAKRRGTALTAPKHQPPDSYQYDYDEGHYHPIDTRRLNVGMMVGMAFTVAIALTMAVLQVVNHSSQKEQISQLTEVVKDTRDQTAKAVQEAEDKAARAIEETEAMLQRALEKAEEEAAKPAPAPPPAPAKPTLTFDRINPAVKGYLGIIFIGALAVIGGFLIHKAVGVAIFAVIVFIALAQAGWIVT